MKSLTLAARCSMSPRVPGKRRILRILSHILPACAFATTLCLGPPAHAFSGWEHETMSQVSLLVASNYACGSVGASSNATQRMAIMRETIGTFYQGLPEAPEGGKHPSPSITYGEISLLADYMKDTYDMLHLPQSRVNLPTDARTSNLPYLRSLLHSGSGVVSLASASHEAYSHFQGRAMDAFCVHHKLAIIAAAEHNLWGALMLSAYANHFLQDTFASGHILTPRDANAHDLDVALLHDDFNNQGLNYVIEAPRQLTQVADTARAFIRTTTKHWPSQDGKPRHVLSLEDDAMDNLCARLASESRIDVFCRGDDKLTVSNLQPAVLMVYCSRAIADVLETYVSGSPVNSFPDYVWDRRSLPHGIQLIDLRLPYGELTCSNRAPDSRIAKAADRLMPENASEISYNVVTSLTKPIYRNPGLGISVGFESVSGFQESHVRGLLEVEGLIIGGRHDITRDADQFKKPNLIGSLWSRNWGLTVGYSGVLGGDDAGQGAFGRLIWPIPQLNLQISLQVGAKYTWGRGMDGFRDFEMLRVDWGLHVLTVFVGIGHDYHSTPGAGLDSGLAFEAGLSIALPYSKLKGLGSITE